MVSKLIEKNNAYFCSNCLIRQPRVQANCFWCGNIFSNYEEMLIKDVNDNARALLGIDPETGRDTYAPNRGQRLNISPIDDSSFISKEEIEKLITEMKVNKNESNIH